jgi:hypothetical protein
MRQGDGGGGFVPGPSCLPLPDVVSGAVCWASAVANGLFRVGLDGGLVMAACGFWLLAGADFITLLVRSGGMYRAGFGGCVVLVILVVG